MSNVVYLFVCQILISAVFILNVDESTHLEGPFLCFHTCVFAYVYTLKMQKILVGEIKAPKAPLWLQCWHAQQCPLAI